MDPVFARAGAVTEAKNVGRRRRHRRHGGPAAHRRRADDGARGDQGRRRACGSALRRGRDDGAGRHQERRRVQPPGRRHGRRAEQARWRRSRRRGALGRRRLSACRSRLSAAASGWTISNRFTRTASCRGCSAWATCCRSSRRPKRPSTSGDAQKLEQKIRRGRVHARGLPRPAPHDPEDGAAREDPRDDPGMGNIKQLAENKPDEGQLNRIEAIIGSMTPRRAAAARRDQRQPPQADRARQRNVGRRGEPSAQAVRADAQDAEAARRDAGRRQGNARRDESASRKVLSAAVLQCCDAEVLQCCGAEMRQ